MIQSSECARLERDGTIAAYVSGALDAPAREHFEDHLILCDHCQQEVLLASTVRAAVRQAPQGSVRPTYGGRARRLTLALGIAAAAAIGAFVAWPSATQPDLGGIAAVDVAPSYLGVAVRGAAPDSMFDAAMRRYDAADWNGAARDLRAALTLDNTSDVAWFFLGASELMAGNAGAADSAFASVLARGSGPYAAESRFYRAKALLRLGRGRDALAQLRQVPASSVIGSHAHALADSLRALGVR